MGILGRRSTEYPAGGSAFIENQQRRGADYFESNSVIIVEPTKDTLDQLGDEAIVRRLKECAEQIKELQLEQISLHAELRGRKTGSPTP